MQKFGILIAVVALFAIAGCNDAKGTAMSKDEESNFRAPLGQPMPDEARKFMEKANQDAQAKMKQGGAPAGAAAPAPPPAATAPQ